MINEDAPTMSAGTGGFSGSSAANGPVAGFDSMMGLVNSLRRNLSVESTLRKRSLTQV